MEYNLEIKEAILIEEYKKIKEFLNSFDLKYSNDIDKTYYLECNNQIIGTISISNYLIKCLAVDNKYQGENISTLLINKALEYFRENKIYSYQVFTKPEYEKVFISQGFRLITKTTNVVMLEGGLENINDEIDKIKKQLDLKFSILDETSDLAALVLNANPVTNGHVYLIEEASKKHKMVVVFVVEEDKSYFSFKERYSLVYLACKRITNVCVLPSTKYIVSSLTFPDYFLKDEELVSKENALCDALIFKNYFMKKLFIKKRYVGSETKKKMVIYNETLKEVLGNDLIEIKRLQTNGNDISASTIRSLIKENKINDQIINDLIPRECYMLFMSICLIKNGK